MSVRIRPHDDDALYEATVELIPLPRERPRQPVDPEIIPEHFRCYYCLNVHDREDIGGVELGQRICRFCWPYSCEMVTGGLIRHDKLGHKPVDGYGAPRLHFSEPADPGKETEKRRRGTRVSNPWIGDLR
jgi:hypothetical protein